MARIKQIQKSLLKKSRKSFRGYPVATVAFYGPDNQRASKGVVGIILQEDGELEFLERWYSDTCDVRTDLQINEQMLIFIKEHDVKSVVITKKVIGCPHEEGIDYPEGEPCPQCPYWAGRDGWTHEVIH